MRRTSSIVMGDLVLITVTPQQLESLSSQVRAGSREIQGSLGTLAGQVRPLVDGEWGGAAAGQFHALWQQWQRAALQLNDSLTGISGLLNRAGVAYQQTENHIANTFRHD